MMTQRIVAIAAHLVATALPVGAQGSGESDPKSEKQQKATTEEVAQAREQMREAEREMRNAEREMREAEREMEMAARRMAEIKTVERLEDDEQHELRRKVVFFGGRPRLGLVLRSEASPSTDPIGAKIVAVTPASPAEEAGLKAGDIIVKVNGERLTGGAADVDEDESAPAARFMELAGDLDEGVEVALEYKRGNEIKAVKLKARSLAGPDVRVFVDHEPLELEDVLEAPLGPLPAGALGLLAPWLDLELASLNPDLGAYFGTTEGVLVVKASKESTLQLKGGDVIVSVGDRAATSPAQTLRVLRSYEAGETVKLKTLRNRQTITIEARIPERSHLEWRGSHASAPLPPAAPIPPVPPIPPAPPAKGEHPRGQSI